MPLVTITHNFGVDGKKVAQTVAQKIGVELYDNQRLHSIVTSNKIAEQCTYNFDLHAPGFWERLRSRQPQLFLDAMEAAVYDIANKGEGVIIGHGSQMLLRDFECAFHVRLASNLGNRVASLISNQELDRDEAERLIARYDKSQKMFFNYAFQIDLDDPSLYDLVLNLGKMNENTITKLIIDAIDSDDIKSCSFDAISSMERMSQERKIHAKLLENNIDVSTLKISVPEAGKARLTGAAVSQEEKEQLADIVKSVDGIFHVDSKVSVWIYPL